MDGTTQSSLSRAILRKLSNRVLRFGIDGKRRTEHRQLALRLLLGRLVLNHIPMLDEDAVLDPQNVSRNPVHRKTHTTESPVEDYKIGLCNDQARFVFQSGGNALD